jgi:hypothetical protein
MTELLFNYAYLATATQTTTLTVAGEEQTEFPDGVSQINETVVVNVSKAALDGLMTVGEQESPGVGYPEVTLDWTGLSSLDSKWASFMTVQSKGTPPATFLDGSSTARPTLQKVFATEQFTFNTNSTNPLLTIPPEAIKEVDYSGEIVVRGENGVQVDPTVMVGTGNTLLGASTVAGAGDLAGSNTKEQAVRGLFLQALAAGKYKQSAAKAPDGSDLPAAASSGFDFAVDDSISVITKMSLKKTRAFIPDPTDALPGAAGMKFTVNGSDVVVDATNDTVDSDDKIWTVEWKLVVVA